MCNTQRDIVHDIDDYYSKIKKTKIFIATGTQKFQFDRLLKRLDEIAKAHGEYEMFAQTGASAYTPQYIQNKPFLNKKEFEEQIDASDLIITHGGTGVITGAIKKGKKVLAVPRLEKYGEHVDDHQIQIIEAFELCKYICGCFDLNKLETKIRYAINMSTNPFRSNTKFFIQSLKEDIQNMNAKKICFASSSGGHFEQLIQLRILMEKYNGFIVTEKTDYDTKNKNIRTYYLKQVNRKELAFLFLMIQNTFQSIKILRKEKPDLVITTGVLAVIPLSILTKLFKKKLIYIESFAKITDATISGKFLNRFADEFYVQHKEMLEVFPDATYAGGIY